MANNDQRQCCSVLLRRHMTLLEILIVIAIIAVTGGFIGMQIDKAVREQRWKIDTAGVTQLLRVAQQLMLILDQDVTVTFSQQNGDLGVEGYLHPQCPLSPGWQRELTQKKHYFNSIGRVSFNGSSEQSTQQSEVTLKFLSGGTVMSKGILKLQSRALSEGGKPIERHILLKGSPSPITFTSVGETAVPKIENQSSTDEMNLTQSLIQDITTIRERQKIRTPQ